MAVNINNLKRLALESTRGLSSVFLFEFFIPEELAQKSAIAYQCIGGAAIVIVVILYVFRNKEGVLTKEEQKTHTTLM